MQAREFRTNMNNLVKRKSTDFTSYLFRSNKFADEKKEIYGELGL